MRCTIVFNVSIPALVKQVFQQKIPFSAEVSVAHVFLRVKNSDKSSAAILFNEKLKLPT